MPLDALVRPRSIVVLGASERPSLGRSLIESLESLGFEGEIWPVNPKYPTILGRPCYPGLDALPGKPDLVAFCIGARAIPDAFRQLPIIGAGAAVIYDAGFAEKGDEGKRLQAELAGLCREAGIALCGPNCMGVLNPYDRSTSYMQIVRDTSRLLGNVGLISQSGSICIGLLADVRRFGFSMVISSGNEAALKTADYIDMLVDDPNTKVIATFTESVRDPERYVAALDRAADAGKPVVVLKVGRSERAQRAITTHTGGLAGETRVFSELLRAHRAIEVNDMDELSEVLAVCQGKRWPKGRRLAVVTASGGQAELILDVGTAAGLELPPLPAAERAEIERVVGRLTGDGNPTDAWGNGDYNTNLPHTLKVLRESPTVDAVVFCSDSHDDQPMVRAEAVANYTRLLLESGRDSDKPHYQMNMRPGVMHQQQVKMLAEAGMATVGGTRQGLGAIDRLACWGAGLPAARPAAGPGGLRLADLMAAGPRSSIHEADAKRLLAGYGIRVTNERVVATLDEALAAAGEIGFPVVLKVVADAIPHRTEHGLVAVGLKDPEALARAWAPMQERLAALPGREGAAFLVQEMVTEGVEVFAGVSRDPDFGPVLAFGLGGVAIEILRDFSLRLLPLRAGEAEAMIGEIRGAKLLGPVRGKPAADVASLAACLYALSDLMQAEGDAIAEIDLNPIKVLPEGSGCVVVDALLVPKRG